MCPCMQLYFCGVSEQALTHTFFASFARRIWVNDKETESEPPVAQMEGVVGACRAEAPLAQFWS